MRRNRIILFGCVAWMMTMCGTVQAPGHGAYARIEIEPEPPMKRAVASWYGDPKRKKDKFHGRRMANGKILDGTANMGRDIPAVAHKSLPFGSIILFRNPKTGASVMAQVSDRGPFVGGRNFDLSWAAARQLGIIEQGVAKIEYAILRRTTTKS